MTPVNKPTRWWDLPAATLLLVGLITASSRLVITHWTDDLSITQNLVVLGLIAGVALGLSKLSPFLAGVFGLTYTLFFVSWQVGTTLPPNVEWGDRLYITIDRLDIVINQLFRKQPVTDSILFVVLMALLFWILSLHSGYILTRYCNVWVAILPTGLSLLVINHYDTSPEQLSQRLWYLAIYLFFSLVLVARTSFLRMHRKWQQTRTALPPQLGLDFIRYGVIAAVTIIALVWTLPALAKNLPAIESITQPVQAAWDRFREQASNFVAPLRSTTASAPVYYGASMNLGRGSILPNSATFHVQVPSDIPSGVRLYWRANVYDTYANGQWTNTISSSENFDPENPPQVVPTEQDRFINTFQFFLDTRVTTLFIPSQPIWVSRPGRIDYAKNPDSTLDLLSFRAIPSLKAGQFYQVQASLSQASITSLRSANSDYPEWIKQRYLQLPDSITQRTIQLARSLTTNLTNEYDKVQAITDYLRSKIKYESTIPSPPPNQEIMDWFLFDLKQGFCNYYATAEVILLRSLGIPARWALGYAQGERQPNGFYQVLQRDAHAWPEVYFSGYGWVEFEPTASQPGIERPIASASQTDANNAIRPPNNIVSEDEYQKYLDRLRQQRNTGGSDIPVTPQNNQNWLRWVLVITAGGLFILSAFFIRWFNRKGLAQQLPIRIEARLLRWGIRPPRWIQTWAQQAALPPLTKAYLEINRGLSRMGQHPAINATPTERASLLGKLIPPADPPAQLLVNEYNLAMFSPLPADIPTAQKASLEIRNLALRARLQNLLKRLHLPLSR